MFGYLIAATELLPEERLERYRACYCGLCRTLKERHGQLKRLTLNYDMTFLVMLFNSLYEPEERSGADRCVAHPTKARSWWASEATEYAADMTVALAYLKCLDDWADDASIISLAEAGVLKKSYAEIKERWPAQCAAMDQALMKLHDIEASNSDSPDSAARCFGELMGGIFRLNDDRWSDTLFSMGMALGKFIYILDAAMDLNSDTFRGRYNPFRRYYGLENNEQRFRDMLKMLLGECVREFDRLPIVQDVDIMKNILCAGLWMQFDMKYSKKKGPADVSGSV